MVNAVDGLYEQYRKLIWYVAHLYSKDSVCLSPEDMFQDGCVMMLEFFRGQEDTEDQRTHNTFKKDLFFWMRRLARRQVKKAKPTGRSMLRIGYQSSDDTSDKDAVNFDEILAAEDVCVLTKLYAKEFVCELSRVLHGPDRVIFHMLVESSRSGEKRGSVIKAAACCLGISVPYVYQRVNTIKKAALKFLQDVA